MVSMSALSPRWQQHIRSDQGSENLWENIEGIGTFSLKKIRLKKLYSSNFAKYKDIPGGSYLSMSRIDKK